jgi:DNA-binding CsgD family transcriptional regulator/tetratricopeptide (TPR) repeat protein
MLTPGTASVAFRHELARIAVEHSLAPDRALALNTTALESLADPPPGHSLDLARLAHHANAANDHAAVIRFAPQAAARAAAVGAHREAAAQYLRAVRHSLDEHMATKAELLELCAHELYLSGLVDEAVPLATQALGFRDQVGDPLRTGDCLRELSHMLSFVGRPKEGEKACRDAIALLEPLGPSPELAMAYATLAQRLRNWEDIAGAIHWAGRARDMADELDEPAILAHALTTLAAAAFLESPDAGLELYGRALEIARAAGLDDHVARIHLNIAWMYVRQCRYTEARAHIEAGLEYAVERGLEYWRLTLVATRSWVELGTGDWTAAASSAASVVNDPRDALLGQHLALVALGLVRARRGDPEAAPPLDEALARAGVGGELQQIAPVAAAKAEVAWLEGRPEMAAEVTERALELALETGAGWEAGELATWRRRLGLATTEVEPSALAGPFALKPLEAVEEWVERGCPYEAALARADTGDPDQLRQALDELQQLGAKPAAAVVTRRLRELGARGLPRGPRPKTRENEAGLTPRELEVLELLTEGLRNVDIAERLFVAEKTVDHHVSSILRKLDARTRGEASIKAVRLGLAAQDR